MKKAPLALRSVVLHLKENLLKVRSENQLVYKAQMPYVLKTLLIYLLFYKKNQESTLGSLKKSIKFPLVQCTFRKGSRYYFVAAKRKSIFVKAFTLRILRNSYYAKELIIGMTFGSCQHLADRAFFMSIIYLDKERCWYFLFYSPIIFAIYH